MDNRRVYKKQNRKLAGRNLASRVKSFLSGSLWRKPDANVTTETEIPVKQDIATPQKPNVDISRFTTPKGDTSLAERTPNAVLSDFFQRKGDKPLNEVEYEGVMSLLSAAKGTNPMYSREGTPSVPDRRNVAVSAGISTPSEQKILKNSTESPRFATPEYRPAYHGAKGKSSGTVKRVYQFSGLPSPYRTKIRPISSPQIRKRPDPKPKDYRSINKAASTLLSVLDNDISKYSNPYKKKMTADAISKSIMFDKTIDDTSSSATTPTSIQIQTGTQEIGSERDEGVKATTPDAASALPQSNVAPPPETSSKESATKVSEIASKPEATPTNSIVSVASVASGDIASKTEPVVVADSTSEPVSNVSSSASARKEPAATTTGAVNGTNAATQPPAANASTFASHFAANSNAAPAATPVAPAISTAIGTNAYQFPTIELTSVTLDPARVNSFKHLFSF